MKKKQVHKHDSSLSRRRYQDAGWHFTAEGERIYCFDVLKNEKVDFTIDEWEKLKFTDLSSGEFKLYNSRIAKYWRERKL